MIIVAVSILFGKSVCVCVWESDRAAEKVDEL